MNMSNDALIFQEDLQEMPTQQQIPWKVLVVDDDEAIHQVTRLVLKNLVFEGRALQLESAYSAAQCLDKLRSDPDTALILLDVVMETDDAGLQVVQAVRDELNNHQVRIILRTGQPGLAPEDKVVMDYDVNDYRPKTELTRTSLVTAVVSALRSYRDLVQTEANRAGLMKILDATSTLFAPHSPEAFITDTLAQIGQLLPFTRSVERGNVSALAVHEGSDGYRTVEGIGEYAACQSGEAPPATAASLLLASAAQRSHLFRDFEAVLYIGAVTTGNHFCVYLKDYQCTDSWERRLLEIFCAHLSLAYDNVRLVADLEQLNQSLEGKVKTRTAQLEQAKQVAESANRAKSIFLANMSHEIRTPMNAILGFTQILRRDPKVPLSQRRETLGAIETAGNHLLDIINDILDLSKVEAGAMKFEPIPFDLGAMVRDLAMMFEVRCGQKSLTFEVENHCGEHLPVQGDQGKVRQVLINLLGNAVKFTDRGGITLRLCPESGDHYLFEVRDTGPGISAEEQQRLFEAFYQGRAGSTKGGTGLGLSISRKQVALMGGELQIESVAGTGSCFHFALHLPSVDSELLAPEIHHHANARLVPGQKVSALVVDDVKTNRDVLSQMLRDIGVDVREAENGQVALEQLRAQRDDIVFMDIRMPVMRGDEAVRVMKREFADPELPCIAISAFSMTHEVEHYIEIGFDRYIAKPFRFEEIVDCLSTFLDLAFETDDRLAEQAPAGETEERELDLAQQHLPETLYRSLREAAQLNRMTELRQLLQVMEDEVAGAERLAGHLRKLLANYDTEGVLTVLEEISHG